MSRADTPPEGSERPPELEALAPERVVHLDLREELRYGHDPVALALGATLDLREGGALCLATPYEPVSVRRALERHGFRHWSERLEAGHWRVWFFRAADAEAAPPAARRAEAAVLDVRPLPPQERHPTVLAAFDALEPGEAILLVNDHDPIPLAYQLQALRPGRFAWEYLEAGPVLWRVAISRTVGGDPFAP